MRRQRGFSLFELIVVVVLIGILAALGLQYYLYWMNQARRAGVESLARNFTAAVAGVHAQWIVGRTGREQPFVDLEGTIIFVNNRGWPTHTDAANAGSPAQRCYQLWMSLLQNPAQVTVGEAGRRDTRRYHISAINGEACRYELITEQPESHFFDYRSDTGQVFVTVPPLE